MAFVLTVSLFAFVLLCSTAVAQSAKIEGLIKARSGGTMIVNTSGAPDVTVLLTDSTEVGQVQGVFQARRKNMSMAALIPGLKVKVEGTYSAQNELVATSVSFKGNDLQDAEKIEAGMHETKVELEKQNAALKAQNEALQQQQAKLNEHEAKIAANKAAVEAAIARFGQLDDYYIEAHQVGNDKTEKGQAENRRVVVRLLQNKGIAGIQ